MTTDTAAHLARLLILLDEFSAPGGSPLDGLTKLAKLDFLLRYPAFLEVLLQRRGYGAEWDGPDEDERRAVAEPMIRYKYGPWDDRYYVLIGALVGRELAEFVSGDGRVALRVTPQGRQQAERLRESDSFRTVASRARVLRLNFDVPGSQLKSLIYEVFPRVVAQGLRTSISASPNGTDL